MVSILLRSIVCCACVRPFAHLRQQVWGLEEILGWGSRELAGAKGVDGSMLVGSDSRSIGIYLNNDSRVSSRRLVRAPSWWQRNVQEKPMDAAYRSSSQTPAASSSRLSWQAAAATMLVFARICSMGRSEPGPAVICVA